MREKPRGEGKTLSGHKKKKKIQRDTFFGYRQMEGQEQAIVVALDFRFSSGSVNFLSLSLEWQFYKNSDLLCLALNFIPSIWCSS